MNPEQLCNPDLVWRDDGQPVSSQFDDPYFSVDNGLEESRYVFLQHNGLPQRWQQWNGPFCILETGFGTGLNFLMTWQAFEREASQDCWLHYTSIEKFPMSAEQLRRAMALWPELQAWTELLLQQYPDAIPGYHHIEWPEQRVRLTLIFGDVTAIIPDISGPVHAWYLDGFAPARNPDMWSDTLFRNIRRISIRHPHLIGETTIATFTSAGLVRRGLMGAGFRMQRVRGYGRKREMLTGRYEQTIGPEQPPEYWHRPWRLAPPAIKDHRVAVIGAGLAGSTTAAALASRGYQVDVFDSKGIAAGGSGNPQGGLYIKLAANDQTTHSDFYLAAYLTSLRWMQRVQQGSIEKLWDPCGVLQLGYDAKEAARQQRFMDVTSHPDSLIRQLDAQQASQLVGTPQHGGGLYFPEAGWVRPALLCQTLLGQPGIQLHINEVTSLQQHGKEWQLQLASGDCRHYPQVVVANASAAPRLLPDAWLPVKSIRGQISLLDASNLPAVNSVLCGHAYMAPALNGEMVIGATYHQNDPCEEVRDSDHRSNIKHLLEFGADFAASQASARITGGRTAFRCTTPDYLPMAGSLPDRSLFVQKYKNISSNARQIPSETVPLLDGLWINIGHGSRGLASAPLCAELIAADISGSARPISDSISEAIWPGRFLVRDMIRKRINT